MDALIHTGNKDMTYIAATPRAYIGQSVGSGQCVAFTQKAANMPRTAAWRRGALVKGNTSITPGTAIATFDADGRYGNHTDGRSHAAIYLGQDSTGIKVLDQWMRRDVDKLGRPITVPHTVSPRTIFFRSSPRAENNGVNYYVVE
ncbi:BPSL0067 family protein [Cronobacter dublinensis]|uniref:BPSL0067 family protein n=1 Tax=Cronobacter dublinensis TaxID=413497 RepID=UPI001F46A56D|nr:BPSL0067 family protein [Cronobacter dublinensis]